MSSLYPCQRKKQSTKNWLPPLENTKAQLMTIRDEEAAKEAEYLELAAAIGEY